MLKGFELSCLRLQKGRTVGALLQKGQSKGGLTGAHWFDPELD
jgi:hypothetical protein